MSGQIIKPVAGRQTFGTRYTNPWIREHLAGSIWKDDNQSGKKLKFCQTKEVECKKKKIAIHMGAPLLSESVEVLNLSVRSHNCLKRCGIFTIDDLMERISSEEDLLKIRNLGKKSAEEILTKLEAYQQEKLREEEQTGLPESFRRRRE